MAKTITDQKKTDTVKFLESTIVPRIKKMVDQINDTLSKKNIRVGLELTWYMDDTTEDEVSNEIGTS